MSEWTTVRELGSWRGGGTPSKGVSSNWQNGSMPWVTPKDMVKARIEDSAEHLTTKGANEAGLTVYPATSVVVVFRSGVLRHTFPVAWAATDFTVNQDMKVLISDHQFEARYSYHAICGLAERVVKSCVKVGTTVESIDPQQFWSLVVFAPPLPEQRRIATILDTVEEAIRRTEQLTAKLKQLKQGLLHDLLTRGLDENGEVRPPPGEAPDLYQQTALGLVPKGWGVVRLGEVVLEAIDGPFGSNLKSSHYVSNGGVRVIRLQNIGVGEFLDDDKAFVSDEHALNLRKHIVQAGDLLVASLGDDRHPCARACVFPNGNADAINKADCFRLRMDATKITSSFCSLQLNCSTTRRGLSGLAQGVTRDRINLQNLKLFRLRLPQPLEQGRICDRLASIDSLVGENGRACAKLYCSKMGLMDDLLTGRVRTTELPEELFGT